MKSVVGADFAGYPLKEAVCEYLRKKGCEIADAYLNAFDYEEYKKNVFKVKKLGDYPLELETKPEE